MTSLNSKARANFDEWLNSISDIELRCFAFTYSNDEVSFGSEDFKLVNHGVCHKVLPTAPPPCWSLQTSTNKTMFQLSTGEPVGCWMIEARISGQTKDKQLQKLFNVSGSLGRDPSRLAFALIPTSLVNYYEGRYVRQALQESPVAGESIVNKIHVQWSSDVRFEDDSPLVREGASPYVYNKIPMAGFNVDGSRAVKKGRSKK